MIIPLVVVQIKEHAILQGKVIVKYVDNFFKYL